MQSAPSIEADIAAGPFGERRSHRLTQDDIRRLLDEPSEEAKAGVVEKIAQDFSPDLLAEGEMAIAEQIFRLLVRDSALRIRQAMADNLAGNPYLPRDIAVKLARDVEAVATPMLTMSEVITDEDLLNLIQNSEEVWRYVAIARRDPLSEAVSAALIHTELPVVVRTLLENHGAEIDEASYWKVLPHAAGSEAIARRMAARPGLPIVVMEKLLQAVSADLAKELTQRLPLDGAQVAAGLRHAGEATTLDLLGLRADRQETIELVAQLYASERLSASLIINALCNGNTDFFEAALARLAGIPAENAHLLVGDQGRLGFRALYNKSQLPNTMYKAVRLLLDSVRSLIEEGNRPGNHHFANRVVARMLEAAEEERIENLSYVLAIIRQRPAA